MNAILKVCRYGIYLFLDEYDIYTDTLHNWGFKLWWNSSDGTPAREETWRWSKENGHARFSWERRRNGKQFDGFTLQGPLIEFRA